jgi:hypothetical protein
MRARHRVGHGVEPGLGSLGRRRACQSAGCHRAIVRSTPAVALRPSVRRRQACGYVDNARTLPTYPQAQQTTLSIKLIASKGDRSDPACHPQATTSRRGQVSLPMRLRQLCADPNSHSQAQRCWCRQYGNSLLTPFDSKNLTSWRDNLLIDSPLKCGRHHPRLVAVSWRGALSQYFLR